MPSRTSADSSARTTIVWRRERPTYSSSRKASPLTAGWPGETSKAVTAQVVGDTTYDVLSRCGDPASADGREELRAIEIANGTFESRMVIVEVWIYDFGPQTFTRLLEFENGKLVKIEAGSWGYSQ